MPGVPKVSRLVDDDVFSCSMAGGGGGGILNGRLLSKMELGLNVAACWLLF